MKIEIWSDVMCPFCYIGKHHFEKALAQLPFGKEIVVDWKSYQLNPDYENTHQETVYEYLSRSKGMPVEQAKQMTNQVAEMAEQAGLNINFDQNIPANTFDAHRLIHLAAQHQLQNEAEERLFKAHFVEGKNIADKSVLTSLALEIGLDAGAVETMLQSEQFAEAVRFDIYESQNLGIRGVPYFVMNRQYGLSGAQPVSAFVEAIQQSFTEWKAAQTTDSITSLNKNDSAACNDDNCAI